MRAYPSQDIRDALSWQQQQLQGPARIPTVYTALHWAVHCCDLHLPCRAEVERYRGETAAAANGERSVALRALGNELASIEEAAEEYESKHGQAVQMVDSLRAAVLDMFNRAGWVWVWAWVWAGAWGVGVWQAGGLFWSTSGSPHTAWHLLF